MTHFEMLVIVCDLIKPELELPNFMVDPVFALVSTMQVKFRVLGMVARRIRGTKKDTFAHKDFIAFIIGFHLGS